jgi:hypothetical protein
MGWGVQISTGMMYRRRAALHRRMKQTGKGTTSSRADPYEKETGLQPLRSSSMRRTLRPSRFIRAEGAPCLASFARRGDFAESSTTKAGRPTQTLLWLRWPFRICHSDTRPKGATRNLLLTSPPSPPQHGNNRGRAALHRRMKQTGKGTTSSRRISASENRSRLHSSKLTLQVRPRVPRLWHKKSCPPAEVGLLHKKYLLLPNNY